MSNHCSDEWGYEYEGGFVKARCRCGWENGPYPDTEDACDALMDHAYEMGRGDYHLLRAALAPDLLRNRIARYIRDLEPVATSKGLADFLSAELLALASNQESGRDS